MSPMQTHRMLRAMGAWGIAWRGFEIIWSRSLFRIRGFGHRLDVRWLTRKNMLFSCREGYCSCWHVGLFALEGE